MFCPLCGAQYREGFTVCSDCRVALVVDPPKNPSANPPQGEDSEIRSFTLLWSGSDARVHSEICEALERKGIPLRSLDTDDYLFNLTMRPAHQVYVPTDLVNSAREAVKQVADMEESENFAESDLLEIPAEEGPENDEHEENEGHRQSHGFGPQDVSVEIWSGENANLAVMIASSLRENGIPYRRDPELSDAEIAQTKRASDELPAMRLLVFPEDEERASEIIREILNAAPPE
jgi:hypothetical protein